MPSVQQFEAAVAASKLFGAERLVAEAAEILSAEAGASAKSLAAWGTKAIDTPNWSISRRATEELLSSSPIHFAQRMGEKLPTELKAGYVLEGSTIHPILMRDATAFGGSYRISQELSAYAVQKEGPFSTLVPIAVLRDGVLVQERVGQSLDKAMRTLDKRWFGINPPDKTQFADFMDHFNAQQQAFERSPSLKALMERSPRFRSQLEQAQVERGIIGDSDSNPWNITLVAKNGDLRVSNIDWQFAFDGEPVPDIPKLSILSGQPISTSTLGKIDQFVDRYKTADGRSYLLSSGLSTQGIDTMLSRARWYLDNQIFPDTILY